MILAGDVGGTKTVVALYESERAGLRPVRESVYLARDHASLEEIVGIFLEEGPAVSIEATCFGVAGPVIDGRVSATNLPWEVDEASLARTTGARRAKLLNDLEAMAYGMLGLDDEEFATLSPGAEPARTGNAVVIAAGTGLGQALLVWDGERHLPVATEGGHAGFAPRSEQEVELLRFLRAEFGSHVSYERILSGPGFHNLYRFLRASGHEPEPTGLRCQRGAVRLDLRRAGRQPGAHRPGCRRRLHRRWNRAQAAAGAAGRRLRSRFHRQGAFLRAARGHTGAGGAHAAHADPGSGTLRRRALTTAYPPAAGPDPAPPST
jgi:glucokinase